MKLPLTLLDGRLRAEDAADVLRRNGITLPERWGSEGGTDLSPLRCAAAVDPFALWFAARFPQPVHAADSLAAGAFHEGLWERDVAECFLADAATGRYIEINLSPFGAWWACGFEAPRRRLRRQPEFQAIGAASSWTDDARERTAVIGIRRDEIDSLVMLTGNTARANFCGIRYPAGGSARLFSLADFRCAEPDFHRPDEFLRLGRMAD